MIHKGGCHCGNISMAFETELDPQEAQTLACLCSFCRKHNSRATADPNGRLTINVAEPSFLGRYSFGYRTAEYLICRNCGVYVAAITLDDEPRALVVVNALETHADFSRAPQTVSYGDEDRETRLKRRQQNWTPVSLHFGSAS